MNSYETYRVCRDCFIPTRFKNPPALEKFRDGDGNCKTCGYEWIGINVGYHNQDRRWCEIRPRSFDSKNMLCRDHQHGRCYRKYCRYAHSKLELQFWIDEEDLMMKRKRPSAHKFRCVICRIDFKDSSNLKTHMRSNEHVAMTEGMKILPEVGSSLEYTGPIRTRPKPSFLKNTYELCRNFTQRGRCGYGIGCKRAHSEEELNVWKNSLRVEEEKREKNRERRVQSCSSYRSESVSYPHTPDVERRAEVYSLLTERIEGESDYVKYLYGEIDFIGIEDVISNRPKHVEILCDNYLTQILEESDNEFKWVLRIKSNKPEILSCILLYGHRNMFRLGGVHKGVEGGKWGELKYPYTPNRSCYQLHQEIIDNSTYIDVSVLFKPRIGQHQVSVVLEWLDGVLVARRIKVSVKGAEFRDVSKAFKAETQPIQKRTSMPSSSTQETLPVNWEQKYYLVNAREFLNKHKMPDNMEERIKTGFYDNINDKIVRDSYIDRFQTLVFLEEFEHKKALLKYDLVEYPVTFDSVDERITLQNDFGEERVETAQSNCRFITFKLRHRLFEGYRGFRPPKLAYVIPKHSQTAFECSCIHVGIDYLVYSITTDTIVACEKSGGLAMVRFTPERHEYESMHKALDDVKPLIETTLFPCLRRVRRPVHWDEDHLLSLLRYQTLSDTQREAVYSIINHRFTSFPTIICGPFGCGKTQTLSVAAKLIALNFHVSRILVVAKTNSCANLYIELLDRYFDTIQMLREGKCQRPILFRHFAFKRKILSWDRRVRDFTNRANGAYKGLPLRELELCSIIVTTTQASSGLVHPKDRPNAKNLFTHIFIDEAAQLIEPEACIPLSLAGPDTKVALAGDVRQSRPLILSKQGRQYNLDQSLLERLETLPQYQPDGMYQCKISLTENFRSSVEIVQFLSELFYDNCLSANPPRLEGPMIFPSLSFLHVKGEEQRLHGFPSFFNEEEAEVTVRALKKFARLGVRASRITVLATYKAQVKLISEALKKETSKCRELGHFAIRDYCKNNNCVNHRTVEASNLDIIQGRQYDLIIVNTVRTLTDIPREISFEERLDLGLLDDVTQFNTILTRARGWVMVVGDSDCVTNVGDCSNVWSKYVDACEGYKGFFKYVEEFEDFGVKRNVREEAREVKREEAREVKREEAREVKREEAREVKREEARDVKREEAREVKREEAREVKREEAREVKREEAREVKREEAREVKREEARDVKREEAREVKREEARYVKQEEARDVKQEEARDVKQEEARDVKSEEKQESKNARPINSGAATVGSCEDAIPLKNVIGKMYQTKFNSIHTLITACQQEITEPHANAEITAAISEQLTFARIALENLERQLYLEQQAILTEIQPSVRIHNPRTNITTIPDCEQATALHLTAFPMDIIQPPM